MNESLMGNLRTLAPLAGVDSAEAALAAVRDFFPDEEPSPRAQRVLRELFG